ncbi:site-2 protease family protein [soil metagenome]
MTALYYTLGVVLFVLAIAMSIGLHEFGHLIPAKKFGGKVTQWFIGFGPTVFSRRIGETEYGVKAIPLGGYVKIVGMLPPGPEQTDPTQLRDSNTGMFTQIIHDARKVEWDTITAQDSGRLFYKMAWWKKVIVMAGGPTVNLLIAFAIFWGIYATYGIKEVVPNDGAPVLSEVSVCVLPYAESGRACTADDPASPAYAAGLRPGDTITSFNGVEVSSWDQLRELVRENYDGSAVIGYQRDAQTATTTTSTTVQARPVSTQDESLTQVGFLGVTPVTHVQTTNGGPIFTLQQMGDMTVRTVEALATLPVKVGEVGLAVIGVQDRAADSPVSIVGGGRIAGEAASADDFPVADKAVLLLSLVAGFNFFIGMFNFLPLLPLDGGHIASALWEALRRGWARLRGRADPGYVDAAKLLPIAYVVASAMVIMGAVLIVGDIVVPIHLPTG